MKEKIKIGMSSCLLGEEVRWDGDHKYDQYVRDVLGSYFKIMCRFALRLMLGGVFLEKPLLFMGHWKIQK